MLWLLWLSMVLLSLAVAIRFFLLLVSAKRKIDHLNGIIDDTRKRLRGSRYSQLDGEGGLAAATMRDNLRLVKAADRLADENVLLQSADWYWFNNCTKFACPSIASAMQGYDAGDVVELRPLHELPTVFVVCDDTGNEIFLTREEADEAAEKGRIK